MRAMREVLTFVLTAIAFYLASLDCIKENERGRVIKNCLGRIRFRVFKITVF